VHRLILQREAIYQFNRFYLLAAVIGSFLIPLVEIEVVEKEREIPQFITQEISPIQDYPVESYSDFSQESVSEVVVAEKPFDWNVLFWTVYGLVTLIFLIRFVRNINLLFDKINKNVHLQFRGETLILLGGQSMPFSFLSYIFVSKDYFESGQLTDSIFAHEQAHVRGRHTWDILLIEAFLVPFWFHPGLYLARQAIKLNHEFIADDAALHVTPLDQYKSFLLAMMLPDQNQGLVSSLNFSLTKKRFEMMKRRTANSTKWIMILSVIPVLGALVYIFSEKVTAQAGDEINSKAVKSNEEITSPDKEINILLTADGKIRIDGQLIELAQLSELIDSKNNEITLARISANSEVEMGFVSDVQEVLRKNEIIRVIHENVKIQKENQVDTVYTIVYSLPPFQILTKAEYYSKTKFQIKYSDSEIEEFSYEELPENYKNNLPNPSGAVSKKVPSSELFESWKNGEEFAIWIDGKVVPNSNLDELKARDIVYYTSSFVHSNARSERFPQNYQVGIYTLSGFENTYGKNSSFGKKPMGGTITIGEVSPKNNKVKDNISSVSNQYIPTSQSYQKQATEFQLRISNAGLFTQPSNEEIEELRTQFLALDQTYFDLSMEDRRKVQRANFPYAKIEKDGHIKYKKFEYLTPQERNALGC
jgi:biopolymer transport protein ExbD